MRQERINKNLGKDTHTRNQADNIFANQNTKSYQILIGEVEIPEPEPLFAQNMVTVRTETGGLLTSVAYPGAFIEPFSGNLHGTYEGPFPGQMVAIGFANGNMNSPFVVNRYPYQGRGNTFTEGAYINPLSAAGFHSFDILMGHFSGSYLSFNTGILPSTALPGSVTLSAVTAFDLTANTTILLESLVTAEVKSLITKITGTTHVELNGNTNFAIKYTEMKTAFDLMKTELNTFVTAYNSHTHAVAGAVGVPTVPIPLGVSATADMSASQNLKVLM